MEKITQKRESGISRVVGVEENLERELLEFFESKFKNKKNDSLEKEKTQEEKELVEQINKFMQDFVRRYGGQPINIQPEHIRIIDKTKLTAEQREVLEKRYKDFSAFYTPQIQCIIMKTDFTDDNKLKYTLTLVHEMLHFNSFASFQKAKETEKELELGNVEKPEEKTFLRQRRMGFRMFSVDKKTQKKTMYFYNIDEAIIVELEMRFDWEFFSKIPAISEEYSEREKIIEQISANKRELLRQTIAYTKTKTLPAGSKDKYQVILTDYTYGEERRQLNELIDDLYNKNMDSFDSREEVFNVFAKAVMTGRLLPVARLIEKTYGKGSFRELGEKTQKSSE